MRDIPFYLFVLSLVLIGLAYYVGLKSDATAIGAQVNSLGLTFTGRNSAGAFAGYPK
jgi:hypothetical protein